MAYDGTVVLDYLSKTHETTLLTDREKHLIGLAVTMTRGCQVCTRGRIEKARLAGINDDVLNALSAVVSSVNAGVAAATAREAFRMVDEAVSEECGSLCSPEPAANQEDIRKEARRGCGTA
jgi:alkylhydroperoxidase/carboxymuconolactone decarboxylase family protein YurZ